MAIPDHHHNGSTICFET